jgi:hypothetical protein
MCKFDVDDQQQGQILNTNTKKSRTCYRTEKIKYANKCIILVSMFSFFWKRNGQPYVRVGKQNFRYLSYFYIYKFLYNK